MRAWLMLALGLAAGGFAERASADNIQLFKVPPGAGPHDVAARPEPNGPV